ncbi:hypothetical protein [Allocoleopsis sp.]|uniref:hypothetical protein n=1 Tax=Allocoleopsis sp. TaxID=3088169 RepID=UPI002FCFF2D2
MSAHNNKKLVKQLFTLMGVASASTLLAFPALANIDSSSSGQLFAQSNSGNTQQSPFGTSGTPETFESPIPQPQLPPVGTGTVPQTQGSPISQPKIPPIGTGTIPQTSGSPISPLGTGTIPQFPTSTDTIQLFPGGTNTTQPNTQINGM